MHEPPAAAFRAAPRRGRAHPMPSAADLRVEGLEAARRALGPHVLGPAEVGSVLGVRVADVLGPAEREQVCRLPFDAQALGRAAAMGSLLVLRIPRDAAGPLSIRRLHERFPGALAAKTMGEGVGYLLRSEWTAGAQPFAEQAPELGWRLVTRAIADETRSRTYGEQDAALAAWGQRHGVPATRVRRRSAVDAVYDTVLFFRHGGERLLADTWDWTRTTSPDAGYVTVGNFDTNGLQILAYSAAVKFHTLGVCPERI
jgi:hypothetical protein